MFACFVESGEHLRKQGADTLAAGLDHQVRDLPIKRIAHGVKRLEPLARIAVLQQRSGLVSAGALPQYRWKRVKVDDEAAGPEIIAVTGYEDRSAPRSEHDIVQCGQLFDHLGLALAKPDLAFDIEDHGDPHPGPRLDFAVDIVERLAEALGELATDRGLTGAHHAHQENLVVRLHGDIVATRPYRARKQKAGIAGPLRVM